MVNIELLPHNEVALKKLNKCLETHQMASINHATGTGKSFIILKYLYSNRNKRILYLAPTYPILKQLTDDHMSELGISQNEFATFDTHIYRTLLQMNMKKIASSYDIIILDEYHRAGAKLWGKKVQELLNTIKEKYPNKKVIGMTATEVRYLDNNRDMNQILFNGVEASRLTLADAILQGILPAPVYINYNYGLLKSIYEVEDRINKYAFYSNDIKKSLEYINKIKSNIESILFNDIEIRKTLDNCKKTLVFSNTIKGINDCKKIINHYFKKIDNEYIVHSGKRHEVNAESLKDFSAQDYSKTSILYSINILNEGVHVKSVDSIFMLRQTSSPIIYFQQLGRLLSYSKRKDKVVVVDLVNNISNSPIIYGLYNEVVSRAKELIITDPANSERYNKIINTFKIIDKSGQLYAIIDELKDLYSKNSIIVRRLETAVSILEGNIEASEVEEYMAHLDIIKYEKYITSELLERIRKLDIDNKPSIVKYTQEEFIKLLDGRININSGQTNYIKQLFEETVNFCDENDRLPTMFSDDAEEVYLASMIYESYNKLDIEFINYIKSNLTDDLSLIERIAYDKSIENIDVNKLTVEAVAAIRRGIKVSPFVSYLVTKNNSDDDELQELVELNTKDDYGDALVASSRSDAFDTVAYTMDFEKAALDVNNEIAISSYDEVLKQVYEEIIKFIKEKGRILRFNRSDLYERRLYCKKILLLSGLEKKGYLKEIDDISINIRNIVIQENKDNIIMRVIEFMKEHNGGLPSAKNIEPTEVSLAKKYIINKNSFDEKSLEKIKIVQEEFASERNKIFIEYIDFIKTNNRRPLMAKVSDEEIELCKNFNRWQSSLTEEQQSQLHDILGSIGKYEEMKKIYQIIKQKKHEE